MADLPFNSPAQMERAKVYERVREDYARRRAKSVDGWVIKNGPIELWACPSADVFNGLMSPRWPEKNLAATWRRAVKLYQTTGQGMFVSFGPSSCPEALREMVRNSGFRCSYHVPFMHLNIGDLREQRCPRGVKVARIEDLTIFREQGHPMWGKLTTKIRRSRFQFLEEQVRAGRMRQFVALRGGELAGCVAVYRQGREAAIFDVMVREEHRRQGIGSRLMFEACDQARREGVKAIGLSASGRGVGLYLKAGFTDAGHYSDFFLSKGRVAAL